MTRSNDTGGGKSPTTGGASAGKGTGSDKTVKTNTDMAYTPPETSRPGMAPRGAVGTQKNTQSKPSPEAAARMREAQKQAAAKKERETLKAGTKARLNGDKSKESLVQYDFKKAKGKGSLRPAFNQQAGKAAARTSGPSSKRFKLTPEFNRAADRSK